MNKIISTAVCVLLLASCQSYDSPQISIDSEIKTAKESKSCYAITPDSALAYLNEFLETSEHPSRGASPRNVASITPIHYNSVVTRSDANDINCENLVYIANFEQEQGYAILAADKRIQDKVIAVTDQGSLSDATVYTAMELANSERTIVEGYPTTGPGFFTLPEYGNEVFMNPNTVSLYDDTEGDTLVGNFSLDDIGAEDEMGNPLSQYNENAPVPEIITSALCTSYAINEINKFDQGLHNFQGIDNGLVPDIGGGVSPGTYTETTHSNWTTKKVTPNILKDYRDWDQKSPFNDWYPKRRKYILFGHRRKAPAGCFPLAIAKILTYFGYPDTYTYNGHTVNWNGLKPSRTDDTSAAALLKGISEGCGSWYFYAGTFTFPHKATSYMRFLGLSNAHSHRYKFDRVTNMIDAGKPLIIYSVPGINVFKSHCWNIDGYKIKERTTTVKMYKNSTLVGEEEKIETCEMVHCDFGWSGNSNGYYVSGVFKLDDSQIEHDPGSHYGGDTNYNNLLKVVTY